MPEYSNPELPEEINNSDRRPLRSFLVLGGATLLVAVVAVAALAFFGGTLARYLPYQTEVRLIEPYASRHPLRDDPVENYLQGIADRLAGRMGLAQGMAIRVHYVNEPVVNAFATLGGHVAVYRGLLERMPDENTLAMIVAHEIGHARHRHPIASLGRGVAFAAALTTLSAGAGGRVAETVLSNAGMLTLLSFSRGQEEEADAAGIAALVQVYGHAGGATDTFRILRGLAAESGRVEPPRFLNTHPLTLERVERLAALVGRNGWTADGTRIPIPERVRGAVASDAGTPKADRS